MKTGEILNKEIKESLLYLVGLNGLREVAVKQQMHPVVIQRALDGAKLTLKSIGGVTALIKYARLKGRESLTQGSVEILKIEKYLKIIDKN